MKRYELMYEVIGHHYRTIEVPDEMSDLTEEVDIQAINDSYIGDDYPCEEYHGDPIEECIVVEVNEIKENE